MNYCRAKRSTWTGKRWKEEILKEIRFKSICDGGTEMPSAALAKDLGFELFSYPAREDGKEIERKPHLVLELQGYKRTYLLASAAAPIGTGMLSVSHRLDPKGKAFVEVSCLTK